MNSNQVFCPKCGKRLPGNAKFCSNCGESIDENGIRRNIPSNTSSDRAEKKFVLTQENLRILSALLVFFCFVVAFLVISMSEKEENSYLSKEDTSIENDLLDENVIDEDVTASEDDIYMSDDSNNDDYGILDESDIANVELDNEEEIQEEEKTIADIKGIIAITDLAESKPTYIHIQITAIDPVSGDITAIRNFEKSDINNKFDSVLHSGRALSDQQLFDENYSKLAVDTLRDREGNQHVGWLDTNGEYTDVTELVDDYDGGDFGGIHAQKNGRFGRDGYFYYLDTDKGACRVPINHLSPENVEKVEIINLKEEDDETNIIKRYDPIFYIEPNGSIWLPHSQSAVYFSDASMTKYVGENNILYWIDNEKCLGSDNGQLLIKNAYDGTPQSSLDWSSPDGGEKFIPEVEDRRNCFPVVSPQKDEAAFLSYFRGTFSDAELFVIPIVGGEPRLVDTEYVFERITDVPKSKLLDWR